MTDIFEVPVQWVVSNEEKVDFCLETMEHLNNLHSDVAVLFPPWDPEEIVERVILESFFVKTELGFLTIGIGVDMEEGDNVLVFPSYSETVDVLDGVRSWLGIESTDDDFRQEERHSTILMPKIPGDDESDIEREEEDEYEEEKESMVEATLEALPVVTDLTEEFVSAWSEVDDGGISKAVASLVTILSQASVMASEGIEWTDPNDLDEVVKDTTVRYGVIAGIACSVVMKVIKKEIKSPEKIIQQLYLLK